MRFLGILVLIGGLLGLLRASNIDTTVSDDYGGRVHNIGLINDKQNALMISGVMCVVGALFIGLGGRKEQAEASAPAPAPAAAAPADDLRKCPACAEMVKREAKICRFCRTELEPLPPLQSEAQQCAEAERHRLATEVAEQKGTCPNCSEQIPLNSKSCPKCHAAQIRYGF